MNDDLHHQDITGGLLFSSIWGGMNVFVGKDHSGKKVFIFKANDGEYTDIALSFIDAAHLVDYLSEAIKKEGE